MSEPVILPSIEGMGSKLGEWMGAIDFQLRRLTKFRLGVELS
jgi:hypothetical protein